MSPKRLLGIALPVQSRTKVLEQIKKYIEYPSGDFQIVSLNPENIIISREDKVFKEVLETAQIKLIDGAGVILAARILGIPIAERITGVSLVEDLLRQAQQERLRVLLIGGKGNLAEELAQCYQLISGQAVIRGIQGMTNIEKPTSAEENKIFSIVATLKPHLLFIAFGSPSQELWLDRHKSQLRGIVCMGVGGAFDYLGGEVARAPYIFRRLGFEWFFRLLVQPWRWRRQLRLLSFIRLIVQEKFRLSGRQ